MMQAQYWASGVAKPGEAGGVTAPGTFSGQNVTTGAGPGLGSQRSPTFRPPLPPTAAAAAKAPGQVRRHLMASSLLLVAYILSCRGSNK
jgi:hypothetical protein